MANAAMRAACVYVLIAWAWTPAGAATAPQEPSCLKGRQVDLVRSKDLIQALGTALTGPQCANIGKVLAQLQSAKAPGGRKLHEGKPLNRAAAEQELKTARADPEFMRRLTSASEGVADPTARMVVEAALLEDDGYFAARQLLMEDIVKAQETR